MDSGNNLSKIAEAFQRYRFDPIMIGNAAAALNGAPVTTEDFDFVVEQTPENYRKIIALASYFHCKVYELKLTNTQNYMYRLQKDDGTFFLDILHKIAGYDELSGIRKRATSVTFDKYSLKVAALEDILHSKKIAGRPKDLAVIPILEMTQNEIRAQQEKQQIQKPEKGNRLH